jgi:methionine biosynthesis protein MetW
MPLHSAIRDTPPVAVPDTGPGRRLLRAGPLSRIFLATEEVNRRAVLRALPARAGGTLLDIGTYDGEFTQRVAERVGATAAVGLELIPQHVEQTRARGITVVEGDVEDGLPFDDETFDVVSANQVIEHVRSTDRFLSELRRVLKPDGVACVSTNNLSSWHNVVSLVLGFQPPPQHVSDELIVGNPINPAQGMPHEDHGQAHLRLFTARALSELADHHGLEVVRVRGTGYYPLPPPLARVAAAIDRRHAAFLVTTLRRRPRRNLAPHAVS